MPPALQRTPAHAKRPAQLFETPGGHAGVHRRQQEDDGAGIHAPTEIANRHRRGTPSACMATEVLALASRTFLGWQAATLAGVRRAMKHAPTVWAALCTCFHCPMLVETRKEDRKFPGMQNRVEHESPFPSASD